MSEMLVILCTSPDEATAAKLAGGLVSRFEELESWLLQHHPYHIPEIVALPVSRVSAD
jgi:uncharacterized protein involved in tolerance to divalent cations